MVNRWLLYQVLAWRVWGRSAFYQSGGAYGFRDQLQDVMALVYGSPEMARAQILRSAARAVRIVDAIAGTALESRLVADLAALRSPALDVDGAAIYRHALSEVGQPPPGDGHAKISGDDGD